MNNNLTMRVGLLGLMSLLWAATAEVSAQNLLADQEKKAVAASKFKDEPRFAKAAKGHIGLQDHGQPAQFRNIKIRPLAAAQPSAKGPLTVLKANPRYFTDGSGKAVYLTGAHTWDNLQDMSIDDPPLPFDFNAYLDFLERHRHNFIRLWRFESVSWKLKKGVYTVAPHSWARTGPGEALDGKPKFDLDKFDSAYFKRLRSRVQAAGERGIYVSVMLFEGWEHHQIDQGSKAHPFHKANNVNGIDGDPDGDGHAIETHTLKIPAVTRMQEAYVRQVINSVGDLDNVLFEIANESGAYSTEWQYHMIRLIKEYEKKRLKQHPVGMTFQWCSIPKQLGTNKLLFDSPADWISPGREPADGHDYLLDPPLADGTKVILNDTDHLGGIVGDSAWVWKSFCRGHNPIFMDPYDNRLEGKVAPEKWDPLRQSLGQTRRLAERVDLARLTPAKDLASTTYCLANSGSEYLVYQPGKGKFTVDLKQATGDFSVEWFDPKTENTTAADGVKGGAVLEFTPSVDGPAVLYLKAVKTKAPEGGKLPKGQQVREATDARAPSAAVVKHVKVYAERGRFGGWPANHGIWSWGDEILVGFSAGHYKDNGPNRHAIDHDKPEEHLLARSRDGGHTWSIENPAEKGALIPVGKALHGITPPGLKEDPWQECPGGIDFTHADFAMTVRMTDAHAGRARFYYSTDRGKTWQGPFRLPLFDQKGIAARTDYLVNGKQDCMLFLTASKKDGREGRPLCVRTTDSGKSWQFVAWIGDEPKGYAIMPSTVRLGENELLSAIRCRQGTKSWIDTYRSFDDGKSWKLDEKPAPDTGEGNPPSMIRLADGRVCLTYGHRAEPYGIRARLSSDGGKTWSDEVILRGDGGGRDVGYPRSVQRTDGKVVTVYYFHDEPKGDRYIAATIWDPSCGAEAATRAARHLLPLLHDTHDG